MYSYTINIITTEKFLVKKLKSVTLSHTSDQPFPWPDLAPDNLMQLVCLLDKILILILFKGPLDSSLSCFLTTRCHSWIFFGVSNQTSAFIITEYVFAWCLVSAAQKFSPSTSPRMNRSAGSAGFNNGVTCGPGRIYCIAMKTQSNLGIVTKGLFSCIQVLDFAVGYRFMWAILHFQVPKMPAGHFQEEDMKAAPLDDISKMVFFVSSL